MASLISLKIDGSRQYESRISSKIDKVYNQTNLYSDISEQDFAFNSLVKNNGISKDSSFK